MHPTLTPGIATATTAQVLVGNLAPDGTIDIQYGIRPDLELCVAPVVEALPRANVLLVGLNAGTTYYVRAHNRRANGTIEEWSPPLPVRTFAGAARDLTPAAITHEPAMLVAPIPVAQWFAEWTVPGFPVENLGYDAPAAWRSRPDNNVHRFGFHISPEPLDTIALLASNAPENARVRVRAGQTLAEAQGVAPAFTFGWTPFRASPALPARPAYHCLLRLPAPQQYPYWWIEIEAEVTGRLFELQHAIVGLNRVSKRHALDKSESPIDLGTLTRPRTGIPSRALGFRMRRVEFDIAALNEAQFEVAFGDLGWRVGSTEPVLVVPNTKPGPYLHDRILYGALGQGSRSTNTRGPLYNKSFIVDSII